MNKIKRIVSIIFVIFIVSIQFGFSQILVPQKGMDAISAEEMLSHVAYLASDEMRGRDTPSPELDQCAKYIANYFRSMGLEYVSSAKDNYQNFSLLKTRLAPEQKFSMTINGVEKTYQIKEDFVPLHLAANRTVTAPVVFAGYGISAPEYKYNDYESIDAKGKIVLAFTSEPQEKDSTSVFNGIKETDHSKLNDKVLNAIDHGAVGFIYVTNPNSRFRRPPNAWPSLMKSAPEDAIPLTLGEKEENKIVAVRIGKQLADDLISASGKTMEEIHQAIDNDLKSRSMDLSGITASITTSLECDSFKTQNVVAFLEGSDPNLKHEIVVIGGHYDHLGARNDTTIYNGADDNASGTAGVMAVAKAFTSMKQRPLRSILFMCFAGEEKGLFGARYYAGTDPLFPIEKTVAMLNMDMIGRNDTSAVSVYGGTRSPDLKTVVMKANEKINLKLDFNDDSRVGGSDHVPFFRKSIPFLFFNTGMHADYHQPTDTVEKINPEKMAQIARIVFASAWQVANMEEKPKLVEIK
ncbi:MAG: M28 family peptidase [bacterium]|nr:M28 family peptidase [bacterium]